MNDFTKQLNNIFHYLSDNNIELGYKNNQISSVKCSDSGKYDSKIELEVNTLNGFENVEVIIDPLNFIRSNNSIKMWTGNWECVEIELKNITDKQFETLCEF